jgi:hypothetical protein
MPKVQNRESFPSEVEFAKSLSSMSVQDDFIDRICAFKLWRVVEMADEPGVMLQIQLEGRRAYFLRLGPVSLRKLAAWLSNAGELAELITELENFKKRGSQAVIR